jgi:putative endonuclease
VPNRRHQLGRDAEAAVARGLEVSGWRILARRWRVHEGEIDLVCLDPSGFLVAVEVRARSSPRTGRPAESLNAAHLGRLRRALARYGLNEPVWHRGLRIDLVTVEQVGGRWRAVRVPGVDGW